MLPRVDEAGADQLSAVITQIAGKLPADQAAVVETFARRYFGQVDPEDMAERQVADLYGVVLSHWNFLRKHAGGARIRVYNPRLEEHGWESTHTVIEIVSDDMPFLVDSIGMEVNRQGLTLHLIIHPVMKIVRDPDGQFVKLAGTDEAGGYESVIHVEVDRRTEPAQLSALQNGLELALGDVQAAVSDWPLMRARLDEIIADAGRNLPGDEGAAEATAFLQWLAEDNFVLLGCRDYDLLTGQAENELHIRTGSGLGVLRDTGQESRSTSFAALPPELKAQASQPTLLTITK